MIDLKTGKRVIVLIDEKSGPYIRISTSNDENKFDKILSGIYYVLYDIRSSEQCGTDDQREYYFGNIADPKKLQNILDRINL